MSGSGSTDFASLSIEIDSSSADAAAKSLDKLTEAGERAEQMSAKEYNATRRADEARQKAASTMLFGTQATAEATREVQKLLDKYDPLGSKLRSLESQFDMLNKAVLGGTAGSSDSAIDKTYRSLNVEIAKTKQLMVDAGHATAEQMGIAERSALNFGLNTQYARRELMTLGREAVSGDFSRMPLTFGSLIAHSQLLKALLSPIGVAVVGIAAAGGALAAANVMGSREQREMSDAIALTGDYAGTTRGQMLELAAAVSEATLATVGQAKSIVTELVHSGQIGGDAIGQIAMIAADYAKATGKDVDKIAPELVKLFADPAKGAEELNKQMHFLSAAEMEHIKHMERIGELGQAQALLADALAVKLPKQAENLGFLESGWNSVRHAASSAWDAMLGLGREATLEDKIKSAQSTVEAAQKRLNFRPNNEGNLQALAQANMQLEALKALQGAQATGAQKQSDEARANALQNQSKSLIDQVSQYAKIREAQDQITLINRFDAKTDEEKRDKAQALHDLDLRILGLRRSATEEERSMAGLAISDSLKMRETEIGTANAVNDARLKLGLITDQEHAQQKYFSDLELSDAKRIAFEKQLAVSNLTKTEKARLEGELTILNAQARARTTSYEMERAIADAARTSLQAQADAAGRGADAASQLGAIDSLQREAQALRLRNDEMGKSRVEVDLLRQAELKREIARREMEAAQSEASEDDPYQQRLRAQIKLLNEKLNLERAGTVKGIQDQFKTPESRENDQYKAQLDALQAYLKQGTDLTLNAEKMREQIESSHNARLVLISLQKNAAIRQMEMDTVTLAAGLLQQFAGKSRAAAVAAILLQKGVAAAAVIVNTQGAIARGYLELGPAAGAINEARMQALMGLQLGIIAATGLIEASQAGPSSSGSSFSGGGSGAAPTTVSSPANAGGPSGAEAQVIQVIINGHILGTQQFVDDVLLPRLSDAINKRDFVIIDPNSRQAANLQGG